MSRRAKLAVNEAAKRSDLFPAQLADHLVIGTSTRHTGLNLKHPDYSEGTSILNHPRSRIEYVVDDLYHRN